MAKQALEARYFRGHSQDRIRYVPFVTDAYFGQIIDMNSGLIGVCTTEGGIAVGTRGELATKGTFMISKDDASGLSFLRGDLVGWDDTAKEAVAGGAGDFNLGICEEWAAAGANYVKTMINRDVIIQTAGAIQVQRGTAINGPGGPIAVTFDTPFDSVPTVVATIGNNATEAVQIEIMSESKTGFTFQLVDLAGINTSATEIKWIAIA